MRVTGGTLRGRRILVPGGDIRPTQDRVREAVFSMLGSRVPGARFLDVYAGSGAVGIEAWSRGASHVCWVESDTRTADVMKANIATLCGSAGTVVTGDAWRFLGKGAGGNPFDIIYVDPPYDCFSGTCGGGKQEPVTRLLTAVGAGGALAADGIVLIEQRDKTPLVEPHGWQVIQDRRYGGTRVRFYEEVNRSALT